MQQIETCASLDCDVQYRDSYSAYYADLTELLLSRSGIYDNYFQSLVSMKTIFTFFLVHKLWRKILGFLSSLYLTNTSKLRLVIFTDMKFTIFQDFSRTCYKKEQIQGLSRAWKWANQIPGLSRFSRTSANPDNSGYTPSDHLIKAILWESLYIRRDGLPRS